MKYLGFHGAEMKEIMYRICVIVMCRSRAQNKIIIKTFSTAACDTSEVKAVSVFENEVKYQLTHVAM